MGAARIPESVKHEHPFQAVGLGMAPFRYVGMVERRIPESRQPCGSCQYCGTGIAYCFMIQSADGKRFVVGSDCVLKTYRAAGTAIPTDIERAIAEHIREQRREKAEAKRLALWTRYQAAKAKLATMGAGWFADQPHPYGFKNRETGEPLTLRDYLEYAASSGCHTMPSMKFFAETIERAEG